MDQQSPFFARYASGRNLLILLALYLFFVTYALPHAAQALQEASGQPDFKPLDLHFGFSPEEAWKTLEALGPAGREHYRFTETVTDVLYPLTYGFFFALLLVAGFRKTGGRLARMSWLAWFPIAAILFDYMENFGIVQLIDAFPANADGWAQFAALTGQIKWICALIGVAGCLIGLIGWLVAGWKARSEK